MPALLAVILLGTAHLLPAIAESPHNSAAASGTSAGAETSTAGSSGTGSKSSLPSFEAADGDFDVKSMITVVKPLANHPACSAEFISEITSALKQFPKPLLRFMFNHGCRICLTPSLIDSNPELRNTKPRGYEQGTTYKNTPAMFHAPSVVVCQYAAVGEGDDDMHPLDDFLGALRHEFGHAVDYYMGRVSYTETFRHIYYLDEGKMDDNAKSELAYYVQAATESGGPSECFAQACCIALGGSTPNS